MVIRLYENVSMTKLIDIISVDKELVKNAIDLPSPPRRNDYEELIIITKGSPRYLIDFKVTLFDTPVLIYVAKGRMHQFLPDADTRGWIIRYEGEVVPQTNFHFYSKFSENSFYNLGKGDVARNMESVCNLMSNILKQSAPDINLVKHLLVALLSTAEHASSIKLPELKQPKNPDLVILDFFLQLLEENYKKTESVQFYADKMYMSVRNLNRLSHLFFEQSISGIIETRKLAEARMLLSNSNMTVAEIGYSLGYTEKSYFTRVFHKKTGYTPTAFRVAMTSIHS